MNAVISAKLGKGKKEELVFPFVMPKFVFSQLSLELTAHSDIDKNYPKEGSHFLYFPNFGKLWVHN